MKKVFTSWHFSEGPNSILQLLLLLGILSFPTENLLSTHSTDPAICQFSLKKNDHAEAVNFTWLVPPPNDACANAIPLTVGVGTCPGGGTLGTTTDATDDGFFGCDATGINNGVWYSFVAPANGEVNLQIGEISGGHEVAVLDACGGTEVFCDISPNSETITGLTPGNTYYMVVWSDAGVEGDHLICLQETPAPAPANDNCANATPLTVGAGGSCPAGAVYGTTVGATDDGTFSCDATPPTLGVWYSFVAPASGEVNLQINELGATHYAAVLDACGGTELICDTSPNNELVSGLTPGNTYYLAIWSIATTSSGPFQVCLQEVPTQANDNCANAMPLTVGAISDCPANATTGSTVGAVDDGAFGCDATTPNLGVWYSFVAPAGGEVNLQIVEVSGNHKAAILDACGGTEVFCDITPNNEVVTGLTPGNTYYLVIWSDAFTSSGTHEVCLSACGAFTPNYLEDFSTFVPQCWKEGEGPISGPVTIGAAGWTADGFANNGTTGSARFNLFNTGDQDWLLTPTFDLTGGGFEIRLDAAVTTFSGTGPSPMGSDDQVLVMQSTDGGATWTTIYTWDVNNVPSNVGDVVAIDISAVTSSTTSFAFWANEGTVDDPEDYNFYVDNFKVQVPPACPIPSTLTATNITASGADLGWTETGSATAWDLEIGTQGFSPTGTPTPGFDNVASNPVTYSGGTANTSYDFYVRADCAASGGSGQSAWAGPFTFATLCNAFTAPYTHNFDANTPNNGSLTSCVTTDNIADCWSNDAANTNMWVARSAATGSANTGPSADHTTGSTNFVFLESSGCLNTPSNLFSPLIDATSLTIPELRFWYHMWGATMGTLEVFVSQDGGATYDPTPVWTLSGDQGNQWLEAAVPLAAYAGQDDLMFRFTGTTGTSFTSDMAIDDFSIVEAPACPDPSGLLTSNVTANSADLTWAPGGGCSVGAEYWVLTTGSPAPTVGTGTAIACSPTFPINVTGLSAVTTYDVWVYEDCGGNGTAGPVNLGSFNTPCATFTAPYTQDFENGGTIPDCWAQGAANGENWIFATTGGHVGNAGNIGGSTASGGYFAYVDDSSPNNLGTTLESPFIDASGLANPELSFYLISNNEGFTNVDFSVDVWDGSAWNVGFFTSNSNTMNGEWELISLDLSSLTFTGPLQLRFIVDETNGTDFYDDVAIDDVTVAEAPSCPSPSGLVTSNVTNNAADLTWTPGGGCTVGAEYWVLTSGSPAPTVGTGTAIACSPTFPINVTGLAGSTTYNVWAYEDCGGSGTAGPVNLGNFTTTVDPLSNPSACQLGLVITDNDCPNNDVIPINVTTAPGTALGTDVVVTDVSIIIEHTWVSDLEIKLASPNGVEIDLTIGNGGSGDHYGDPTDATCTMVTNFNMAGPDGPITAGTAPFIGSYIPEGDFASFNDGSNPVGTWELRICDSASGDVGQLEFVSITFGAPPSCPSPSGLVTSNVTNNAADLTWTPGGGCTVGAEYWVLTSGSPAPTAGTGTAIACSPTFPINVTGLAGSTTYDVWAYEDCGGSGTAGPVNLGNFTTTADPLSNPSACQLGLVITDDDCPNNDVIPINVTTAPGTALGTDVVVTDVSIIIEHTWVSDLEIKLASPNGVEIDLSIGNGGSGDHYGDPTDATCTMVTNFNMTGPDGPITAGTAPFIGSYVPEGDFASFNDGSSPVGSWELRICDSASGDVGQLEFVSITFGTVASCAISGIVTGNISACNDNGTSSPGDDTFTADVTVTFADPPASGNLDLTGDGTASIDVANLDGPTSHTFIGVTMPADGGDIALTATFSADMACTFTENNAGTAPASCSCNLVINEVDYDQPGGDDAEFVELYNPCADAVDLSGYTLELVNGSGGGAVIYQTITLSAGTVPAGGYYVICLSGSSVPNCNEAVIASIQNGAPDAVGLRLNGNLVDAVSYEGDSGAPYTEGSGVGLEDPGTAGSDNLSISRYPDGVDTDMNNVDFSTRCATPGVANSASTAPTAFYADTDMDGFGDPANSVFACDQPAGYVTNSDDCDDTNMAINPNATEVCDGVDNNCDGNIDEGLLNTYYADTDMDGFGDPAVSQMACTAPAGYVDNADDCDDTNMAINPNATEVCDGVDNNCDGNIDEGVLNTYYADTDMDGFGDPAVSQMDCTAPAGYVDNSDDCDDTNPNVNPNATETCNGIDDNCDGNIDEGLTFDADMDGYTAIGSCGGSADDCDDNNPNVNPGAMEVCNGIDDDCNGMIDDGALPVTWYQDSDMDGFGNPAVSQVACSPPAGYVGNADDCDDTNMAINPNATEVCDGVDNNCDGNIDEGVLLTFYADTDMDGYGDPAVSQMACTAPAGYVSNSDDCDDTNNAINPDADEVCDGVDNDCDGTIDQNPVTGPTWYADSDMDGFGDPNISVIACSQPAGYVNNDLDCNDNNNAINPNADEICDGIDNDCDGQIDEFAVDAPTWYQDADMDGFGNQNVTLVQCTQPAGYVGNFLDCNDGDANINPNTTWYVDFDGDGFGNPNSSVMTCDPGTGYVLNGDDCNDNIAAINPNATEICDGLDNNCDGNVDEGVLLTFYQDADMDGFGNPAVTQMACTAPAGYVANANDCDDTNMAVNPNATEVCDGVDNNCDGNIDEGVTTTFYADTDMDGFGDPGNTVQACALPAGYVANGTDCNDNNSAINPNATEVCGNAIDDNCNGTVDENCDCTIVSVTVSNISACNDNGTANPFDDTFTADVTVIFASQPTTGTLNLSGDVATSVAASSLAGLTSYTFATQTMSADGSAIQLTASFSDDPNCTLTNNNAGVAPGPCSGSCFVEINSVQVSDESCPGAADGQIIINATSSGQTGYSIDGGVNFVFNNVFSNLAPGTYDIVVQVFGTPPCFATGAATVNPASGGAVQTWYKDYDNDGYSDGLTIQACSQPQHYKLAINLLGLNNDCNDYDADQYPGQTWYKDFDNDGYSDGTTLTQCEEPYGYQTAAQLTATSGDCDDNTATTYPGAPELCNGIDDDCDGMVDEGAAGGLTYIGNVVLTSQAQVDAFSQCYSIINGNLTIQNAGITNLANLSNIVEVTGNVTIQNTSLVNLSGLDALTTVGGTLTVKTNGQLVSLDGLDAVSSVGGSLLIFFNLNLTDCCAIYTLLNTPGAIGGAVSIFNNQTGCESVPAVNADCNGGSSIASPSGTGNSNVNVAVKDAVQQVDLFPNPASEVVNVTIAEPFLSGSIRFLDLQGRVLLHQQLDANTTRHQIDMNGLSTGVYLVQVLVDDEQFVQRLVIK